MTAPKLIPNYNDKFDYLATRKKLSGSVCPIGLEKFGRCDAVHDLHHAGIHNTELNRKLYPVLVHSTLNLVPVNHDNHLNFPSYGRRGPLWAEKLEEFLNEKRHWKFRVFVTTSKWPEEHEKEQHCN
jgi:hypothetical protein